jgi:hypothetical protein
MSLVRREQYPVARVRANDGPQPGDVIEFVDRIQDEGRREHCRSLLVVMQDTTGEEHQG